MAIATVQFHRDKANESVLKFGTLTQNLIEKNVNGRIVITKDVTAVKAPPLMVVL